MKYILSSALVLIGSGVFFSLHAQEKRVQRKDLPAAVEAAVARESEGATVKGFSTEMDHGVRVYEAEMMVDGRSKDVVINSKGDVLEIEQEVAMDSLPAEVRTALKTAAGSGTIGKIESLTKRGKLVAYETVVTSGKKHREIQVGPNGEKLARPH